MKVLLLHPDDELPTLQPGRWDLIVDFGRAPASTYESWQRQAGCSVLSVYEFAEEVEDLYYAKDLLRLGMGRIVDQWGIDWWDVLCLEMLADLQQLILVRRLSRELTPDDELYMCGSNSWAKALQCLLGGKLINLETIFTSARNGLRHYQNAFWELSTSQIKQVLQDKFDSEHSIRRWFAAPTQGSDDAVVLLPSAYINVSRTAISYAAMLPDEQFLLVCARNSGKVKSLPPNVRMVSLDGYFRLANRSAGAALLPHWEKLKDELRTCAEEYKLADAVGILGRMPSLIRWGISLRNAWMQVFVSENVTGCLCADDSNPYTRIPLILASKRGIPTVACHHGALDFWMAVKTQHADYYLAKNEMEHDYLLRRCRIPPERIFVSGPPTAKQTGVARASASQAALVFFTEPYQTGGWRTDEIYRDLLPRLYSLAQTCGLKLVFKLHPFESVTGHRRILRKYLADAPPDRVEVIAGTASPEFWQRAEFAMTVQSTVALECTRRGIPVFLCAWLRHPYAAYVQQFTRFGIGHALDSPEQIADIPALLATQSMARAMKRKLSPAMDPDVLRRLLTGVFSPAQCTG